MLEAILSYITQKLNVVFPEMEVRGLAELIQQEDNRFPAVYDSEGELSNIDFDAAKGTIYFRRNGSVLTSRQDEENDLGCAVYERHSHPVRAVLFCPKDIYKTDNSFIDNKVAENFRKALTINDDKILRATLKADSVIVECTQWTQDKKSILSDEFEGEIPKIGFEYVLIAVEMEVQVVGPQSCFDYWGCDDTQLPIKLCQDVTITNTEGDVLGTEPAGGTYEVQDSEVTNSDGTVLAEVPATENYEVADSLLINTNGDILDLIPAETTSVAPDGLAKNTLGTTVANPPSGSQATVANSLIKDSSGTTIHSLPATVAQTISDSLIKDSNGATIHSVKAEAAQIIADCKIYLNNTATVLMNILAEGSKTTRQIIAAMTGAQIKADTDAASLTDDFVQALSAAEIYADMTGAQKTALIKLFSATELNGAVSIATRNSLDYIRQIQTGQTISRRTGDGPYYASTHGRLTDFFTLKTVNIFSNLFRFTDELGNRYTDPDNSASKNTPSAYANSVMMDHGTGIMYYLVTPFDTWPNGIDNAEAFTLTVNGTLYSDWFMPNMKELFDLARYTGNGSAAFNWYPVNPTMFGNNFHTATPKNATNNVGWNGDGEEFITAMASARNYIRCRYMTDAELGL